MNVAKKLPTFYGMTDLADHLDQYELTARMEGWDEEKQTTKSCNTRNVAEIEYGTCESLRTAFIKYFRAPTFSIQFN